MEDRRWLCVKLQFIYTSNVSSIHGFNCSQPVAQVTYQTDYCIMTEHKYLSQFWWQFYLHLMTVVVVCIQSTDSRRAISRVCRRQVGWHLATRLSNFHSLVEQHVCAVSLPQFATRNMSPRSLNICTGKSYEIWRESVRNLWRCRLANSTSCQQ